MDDIHRQLDIRSRVCDVRGVTNLTTPHPHPSVGHTQSLKLAAIPFFLNRSSNKTYNPHFKLHIICQYFLSSQYHKQKSEYQINFSPSVAYDNRVTFYRLGKGGYVFGSTGLSVCQFVDITQKVMNGLG